MTTHVQDLDDLLMLAERELLFLQETLGEYPEVAKSDTGAEFLTSLVTASLAAARLRVGDARPRVDS
jgi:hypothetical protein